MSEEIIRNMLAGNPASKNTFASEQLRMQDQFRRQQEAEMIAAQEAGLYGSSGASRPNMHGEAIDAFTGTDPGQALEGAVHRLVDAFGGGPPKPPRYNEQGERIHEITGMPAPWVMGAGPGPKPGGFFSKLRNLFSSGRRKVGDFFGTSPVGHANTERLIKNLSPAQEAAINKHMAWVEANPSPSTTAPAAADDFLQANPGRPKAVPPPHPTPEQIKQAKIHQLQQEVLEMGGHKPGDLTPAQADAMMWPPAKKPILRGPDPVPDFNHPVLNELDDIPVRVSHPLKSPRPGVDQPITQRIAPEDQLPLYDEMVYYGRPRTESMPGVHINSRQYNPDGVPIATPREIEQWMATKGQLPGVDKGGLPTWYPSKYNYHNTPTVSTTSLRKGHEGFPYWVHQTPEMKEIAAAQGKIYSPPPKSGSLVDMYEPEDLIRLQHQLAKPNPPQIIHGLTDHRLIDGKLTPLSEVLKARKANEIKWAQRKAQERRELDIRTGADKQFEALELEANPPTLKDKAAEWIKRSLEQ